MKKLLLTVSVALASLLAANAFAQGEATPGAGADKAAPSQKATKAERAAAIKQQKAAGRAVSKSHTDIAADQPASSGEARKVSKSERKLAGAKRRAAGAEARKSGETKAGEAK